MRNVYRLLSFVFVTCGLSLSTFAYDGDTLTVGGTPKNNFGNKYSFVLKKDSSSNKINFTRSLGTESWDDKGIPIYFGGVMNLSTRYRTIKSENWPTRTKSIDIPYNGGGLLNLNMNMQIAPGFSTLLNVGFSPRFNGAQGAASREVFSGGQFGAVVNYKTRFAMIKIGAGDLVTGMSALFVGGAGAFGRTSPFYRFPWDNVALNGGSFMNADNTIFRYGSNNSNLDPFFTNGGRTRGFVLQASQMPLDLGLNVSYGVDPQTGTFNSGGKTSIYDVDPSKKTFSSRLYKTMGTNIFGANLIINNGYFETVSKTLKEKQNMMSGDVFLRLFDYFTFLGEIGATSFSTPFGEWDPDIFPYKFWGKDLVSDTSLLDEYNSGLSYLGKINLQVDERKFGFPIRLILYSLGPNFVNANNSAIINTYTYNLASSYINVGSGWDYGMRRGVISEVGQMANNRRAVELNTTIGKKKLRVNIGTQVSQEIEKEISPKWNQVMFSHKLNSFSTSSMHPWAVNGGPYGNLFSTFFQLQERVAITDTAVDYRKTFNSFIIDARYKTKLFGKEILMENYINYQSASDHFSPLPFVTDIAFVRVFFNEFMFYYRLKKDITLVGLGALQRAVGNDRTKLSPENGKPINHTGYGFGGGFDFDIDSTTGLYLRGMWNSHKDPNFIRDTYTLFETTIDFKIFF